MQQSRLFIIVLYKTDIAESNTVKSLIAAAKELNSKDKLTIWDNSPQEQPREYLKQAVDALRIHTTYRHTPENISLAHIYNSAIAADSVHDLVFLFDQDSYFDSRYLSDMEAAVEANAAINLFVPLIKVGETVVSPGHFHYFKGKYWDKPRYGIVPANNNIAIASGMCIRMQYIRQFGRFDERLNLYGIDTNFMIRYSQDNQIFYVVKTFFQHHLSDFAVEKKETKDRRFADFKRSSIINAKLFPLHIRLATHAFLFYRTLKHLISR